MPRRKPVQDRPKFRKQTTDYPVVKNFDYSCSVPCSYNRCIGFMFLVTATYEDHGRAVDELECAVCHKIKKMGNHEPNRAKPQPLPPRTKRTR